MATNDFYKAITVLKAQKEQIRNEYDAKKQEIDKEYHMKDKQLDTAIDILYEVGHVCPDCEGSGRVKEYDNTYDDRGTVVPCKKCKGTGTYIYEVKDI